MSTQKILQINPELFKFNGGKKSLKHKKDKKSKPIQDKVQTIQSNKLKKELLKKVKDYQKNKETEVINEEKTKEKTYNMPNSNLFETKDFENNDFEREFNKSLSFLHDLSKKNKTKHKNKTLKSSNVDINIEIPKDSLIYNSAKEPNYSCLKNGSKPTFRDLNKTQKHNANNTNTGKKLKLALENNTYYEHSEFHNKYSAPNTTLDSTSNIELKISEKTPKEITETDNLSNTKPLNILSNETNNEVISASYNYNTNYSPNKEKVVFEEILPMDIIPQETIKLDSKDDSKDDSKVDSKEDTKEDTKEDSKEDSYIPKLRRITRTYKYKLGKKPDSKYIGLLIKNRETQKKIKQEVSQLKQRPIQDVKNFLREKNLIKLGSQAPNDVLRKLYEDSELAGEITNTNNNNLVHNYLNDA